MPASLAVPANEEEEEMKKKKKKEDLLLVMSAQPFRLWVIAMFPAGPRDWRKCSACHRHIALRVGRGFSFIC
jgi:hypothetical protein